MHITILWITYKPFFQSWQKGENCPRSWFWLSTTLWMTWTRTCTRIYLHLIESTLTGVQFWAHSTSRTSGQTMLRFRTSTQTATKLHHTQYRKLKSIPLLNNSKLSIYLLLYIQKEDQVETFMQQFPFYLLSFKNVWRLVTDSFASCVKKIEPNTSAKCVLKSQSKWKFSF